MSLKQIRAEERRTENENRKRKMLDAAFACFGRKGIEAASMADIAREAGFGEATVYRYFSNKETLALKCGIRFWDMACGFMKEWSETPEFQAQSGLEQVEGLIGRAFAFYRENREGFCLIHNLDGFLLSHKVGQEQLSEYERAVDSLRPLLCNALEKGKQDGSIRSGVPVPQLYYAMTTGIMSVMQKQAAAGSLLASDRIVDPDEKLELFLELVTAGVKSVCGKQEG